LASSVLSLAYLASGLAPAGCAARRPQRLDQRALRASEPRTLAVVEHGSLAITSEGPANEGPDVRHLFGLLGTLAIAGSDRTANRNRARWMKGCEVEDPGEQIRETLAEAFAKALSLHVLGSDRMTKATAAADLVKDHPGADLILDIRTFKWGIHRVEAPNARVRVHFAVGYEGALRLIDARKGAVIVDTTCSIQFSNGDDPPTINELFADDCALLDKGLTLSAATCVKRHGAALGLDITLAAESSSQ